MYMPTNSNPYSEGVGREDRHQPSFFISLSYEFLNLLFKLDALEFMPWALRFEFWVSFEQQVLSFGFWALNYVCELNFNLWE